MPPSLFILTALSAAHAETPLHAGELAGSLANSAHILPTGEWRLQLFNLSSYGLHERVELQTVVLGWLAAPNLSAEISLLNTETQALSLSPYASIGWNGSAAAAGANATYTLGGSETHRLNLGLGAGIRQAGETGALSSSVSASYEIALTPQGLIQLAVQVDPLRSVEQTEFVGSFGGGYVHGWEYYRLEVALLAAETAGLQAALDDANISADLPPFLPMPYLLMWWRF